MIDSALIPEPVELHDMGSSFLLNQKTKIVCNENLVDLSKYFNSIIRNATGFELPNLEKIDVNSEDNYILFEILSEKEAEIKNPEGYILQSTEKYVKISAIEQNGLFYGIQTLRQLLPPQIESSNIDSEIIWCIPSVKIKDYPRFSWRGFMLDEGRHFQGKQAVKKFLDQMALLKLNKFHWHLTEDQGWRIEIKKYPKLTEIGSKRKDTAIRNTKNKKFKGISHEGYYTQAEIKEIVEYAKERYITIIPEIEIPGHSQAAIASYPKLTCDQKQYDVASRFGVIDIVYCPGKPQVFEFWKDVLDEVMELFPSEIIHIGGDEVPKRRWKECPDCQAKIKKEGLKNEDELQVFVTNSMASYLASKGRRLMGWNEILDDGLESNAICHYWAHSEQKILENIKQGRDVVVSRNEFTYLNTTYKRMPLKRVYNYNPLLKGINDKDKHHILGIEAPLWTEWVPNPSIAEFQIFPRLLAISENAWISNDKKNYESFMQRLKKFSHRMNLMSINYAENHIFGSKLVRLFWNLFN